MRKKLEKATGSHKHDFVDNLYNLLLCIFLNHQKNSEVEWNCSFCLVFPILAYLSYFIIIFIALPGSLIIIETNFSKFFFILFQRRLRRMTLQSQTSSHHPQSLRKRIERALIRKHTLSAMIVSCSKFLINACQE